MLNSLSSYFNLFQAGSIYLNKWPAKYGPYKALKGLMTYAPYQALEALMSLIQAPQSLIRPLRAL